MRGLEGCPRRSGRAGKVYQTERGRNTQGAGYEPVATRRELALPCGKLEVGFAQEKIPLFTLIGLDWGGSN